MKNKKQLSKWKQNKQQTKNTIKFSNMWEDKFIWKIWEYSKNGLPAWEKQID